MDPAFKILGGFGLALSAGAMLGMTTPTEMKLSPEPSWRLAARSANAGQPVRLTQSQVVYSGMPEDLSTDIGYGSPAAYEAFYVNAPVRSGYAAVPDYSPAGLDQQPQAEVAADAAALAARDARDEAVPAPEPVKLASAKTVEFDPNAASPENAPVFDTSGDAPAMDAGGGDE
jgi:hypothetical protein